MTTSPREGNVEYDPYPGKRSIGIAVIWLLAASATIVTLVMSDGLHANSLLARCVVTVWAILPPLWFFVERAFVFPKFGNLAAAKEHEYRQSLAARVWAGAPAAISFVLGFGL